MQERWMRAVVCSVLVGCSFTSEGTGATDTDETEGEATAATPTDPTLTTAAPTTAPTSGASNDSDTEPVSGPESSGDATDSETSDPTTDTDGPRPARGCPDDLPDDWILCEDFEGIQDPADYFAIWASNNAEAGNRFRIDGMQPFSGDAALTVQHEPTFTWAGALTLRFGAGPGAAPHAPAETFDEVWLRSRVFLEDGWDQGGHSDFIELNSVTTGFVHVMSASVDSMFDTLPLRARARTCVNDNGSLDCDGNQDWQTLRQIDIGVGETEFFTPEYAGEWHCILLHVRLNEPGQADGLQELFIDDELEVELSDLDQRGEFDEVGLNAVVLSGFWEGGAAEEVHRYVDDLVLSTAELSCG